MNYDISPLTNQTCFSCGRILTEQEMINNLGVCNACRGVGSGLVWDTKEPSSFERIDELPLTNNSTPFLKMLKNKYGGFDCSEYSVLWLLERYIELYRKEENLSSTNPLDYDDKGLKDYLRLREVAEELNRRDIKF